ncbi:MAG TPA: glucosamine-6-phosphate deaminase [Ilumatobacteraceae bacterium]|nr:glucosamine-6-phosphate deaminase [Ilumatobacteraceae bacterium]
MLSSAARRRESAAMEIVIQPDAAAVAVFGADIIERLIAGSPHAVLGLATGSSPLALYDELVRRCNDAGLSFAEATAFLLDEYIGLPVGHPASYRVFIQQHFTGLIDIDPRNVHVPEGAADDIALACNRYEAQIRGAGGIDLQLLGIGADGHLGFNEPTSSLASRTRVKTLTAQTRRDNARFFDNVGEVPSHVVTQGIGTILDARHLLLIAVGAAKAEAIAKAVEGPVSSMCPASAMQLHPHVTVVVDEAAAARLTLADYYRDTFAGKPPWQSS